jgi:hypothetical protein
MSIKTNSAAAADVAAERTPQAVIEQVKAAPDFVVHKVKMRVSKSREVSISPLIGLIGSLLGMASLGLALGFIAWLVWKYWREWLPGRNGRENADSAITARVVLGMAVTPESLPQDIPGAALALWRQGLFSDALGLLYRGAISKVIEQARVEILEADTEGDCLRRVEQAGASAHPEYFRSLTGVRIGLAYASQVPGDAVLEALCRDWPFAERRSA